MAPICIPSRPGAAPNPCTGPKSVMVLVVGGPFGIVALDMSSVQVLGLIMPMPAGVAGKRPWKGTGLSGGPGMVASGM